jgi:hypothetical protein
MNILWIGILSVEHEHSVNRYTVCGTRTSCEYSVEHEHLGSTVCGHEHSVNMYTVCGTWTSCEYCLWNILWILCGTWHSENTVCGTWTSCEYCLWNMNILWVPSVEHEHHVITVCETWTSCEYCLWSMNIMRGLSVEHEHPVNAVLEHASLKSSSPPHSLHQLVQWWF